MLHVCIRLRAWLAGLCVLAALSLADASAAQAAKIKMVFPGPVTTFSLPYLVAQKNGAIALSRIPTNKISGK